MSAPFPAPPVPHAPDGTTQKDRRIRGWLAFSLGLIGGAHQIFLASPKEPGVIAFCCFLLGAPAAEKLWASRGVPE